MKVNVILVKPFALDIHFGDDFFVIIDYHHHVHQLGHFYEAHKHTYTYTRLYPVNKITEKV